MHLDPFNSTHRLSDWLDTVIEVGCSCSAEVKLYPVRMLLRMCGDGTFNRVIAALRCSACGGKPVVLYVIAGMHRRPVGGPLPCWNVQLVTSSDK